jgi:spore germination cell wall hydrolase CwlJ-like protein
MRSVRAASSMRQRPIHRHGFARPLKPWLLAGGVLVSFTAAAGVRPAVDTTTPGLRFAEDPLHIAVAWPTLTPPDVALAAEDLLAPDTLAPPAAAAEPEVEEEPHLSPGFWRGAQATDGTEGPSEATPEISVLFRLGSAIMPAARSFAEDDGGPPIGLFSGMAEPEGEAQPAPPQALAEKAPAPMQEKAQERAKEKAREKAQDTIVVAKAAPPVSVPLPAAPGPVRLPPGDKPVPPRSPLVGVVTSEKEFKCLAEAVYFEARSEPERGQAGVAQVVLNRVRSGVYPSTVCGVVYQNRHKYLACQFTFACEGKSLRITEPGPWATAQRIARDVAEGRTYLPGVGNATHYHANYVRPWWARHMDKREKVGSHIFYYEQPEN